MPPGGGTQGGATSEPVLRLGSLYGNFSKLAFLPLLGAWGGYIIYIAHACFVQQLCFWFLSCVKSVCVWRYGRFHPKRMHKLWRIVLEKVDLFSIVERSFVTG